MAVRFSFRAALLRSKRRFGLFRFGRDETGATAVEFGLIALPFFALLFAILETGLVFFAGQTLETAVANVSRTIRTGQAQQQGLDLTAFRNQICAQISALMSCSGLSLDVRTYASFSSVNLANPINSQGKLDTSNFTYDAGNGGDIVVVRAFYEWPTYSRMLGFNLSNLADGNHLLAAAAAFKNEPFPW